MRAPSCIRGDVWRKLHWRSSPPGVRLVLGEARSSQVESLKTPAYLIVRVAAALTSALPVSKWSRARRQNHATDRTHAVTIAVRRGFIDR